MSSSSRSTTWATSARTSARAAGSRRTCRSAASTSTGRASEGRRGTGCALTTNSANLVTGAAPLTAADSYSHQKSHGPVVEEQLGIDDRPFLQVGAGVDLNSAFASDVVSFFLPKAGVA